MSDILLNLFLRIKPPICSRHVSFFHFSFHSMLPLQKLSSRSQSIFPNGWECSLTSFAANLLLKWETHSRAYKQMNSNIQYFSLCFCQFILWSWWAEQLYWQIKMLIINISFTSTNQHVKLDWEPKLRFKHMPKCKNLES